MRVNVKNIKSLIHKWRYAVLAWPIVSMSLGLVAGFDELPFIVGGFLSFGLEGMRQQYLATLAKRAEVPTGMIWRVNLNDVLMGEIGDADYARLQLGVFNDKRVYARQLANLGRVAAHALDQVVRTVPLAAFWIGLAGYTFFPTQFATGVQSIMSMTHEEAVAASGMVLRIALMSILVSFAFHWGSGTGSCGFVNHFRAEINRRLRLHFEAAADGEVSLNGYLRGAFENDTAIRTKEQ